MIVQPYITDLKDIKLALAKQQETMDIMMSMLETNITCKTSAPVPASLPFTLPISTLEDFDKMEDHLTLNDDIKSSLVS